MKITAEQNILATLDLTAGLTKQQAEWIYEQGKEIVVFILLKMSAGGLVQMQKCLGHLLREIKHIEKYKDSGGDWSRFAKKLKRLLHDAIRLRKRKCELNEQTLF